ncbi:uncharacterized protein LOC113271849 [Papaver somniferum]|uniref:uncharacterized protein LOC113271849 n=1 Tax=Papaver somniferum TaxID=3469 RepID=UPI000E6FB7D7|nr:uncharacterized protein LOC113271849 [Papaver somniferum]
MKRNLTKWAVLLRRKDGIAEDDKIMRDVNWNDKSNNFARRSNGSSWLNCPVILGGPYISGKAEDGSDIPLPEKFSSYQPWEFVLSEAETKKVTAKRDKTSHNASASQNNKVKYLSDKTSSKGKYIPKRPTSKSSSETTSTMDDLSRKRKRYDSSSSSESSEDDISVSDDSSIPSSLKELSNIFAGDLLTAVDNEELNRAFGMVSKICDAPTLDDPSLRGDASAINPNLQFTIGSLEARLSYVISSDYQRRLTKLEKENAKLKAENSTNSDLIRRARERNDELIDLCNLSDEAANLLDGETLLEHRNSSLNNYPNQGFENMNLEELRLKYAALRKSHRSLLTTFNNSKHRLHESQEQIQVLETKKNKFIDEKDEITLKGVKAPEKFQESIIEVQKERDLALIKKNILVEERNLIRPCLLIESETEFSWAARVLNDARKDLAINVSLQAEHSALVKDIVSYYEDKEKNYLQKIAELENRLASEEEKNYPHKIEELETLLASEEKDLFARNSKYQQLKKNFIIMVSNNSNDDDRAREAAVKKVCVENNIPLTKYKFPEIPDNEHISDISDNEGEDEGSEEEISGSEVERGED